MLISTLKPLLDRFNLKIDLRAAPDALVQLTIVPQKADGSKLEGAVLAPISLTATASELDAELAKGEEGAIARLVSSRRSLAEQIADQEALDAKAAADAKDKAAAKAATAKTTAEKATAAKPAAKAATASKPTPKASAPVAAIAAGPAPDEIPAGGTAQQPGSLW